MNYLKDFIYYNSGNECPRRFWQWSALTLLGHIVGRKVWYMHGKFQIYPQLYTGLIGDAGSGKSTAKTEVKSIVVEHFPDLLYSASIQSREDIVKKMSTDQCIQTFKTPKGEIEAYRPFFVIANEFENFLSVDPIKMVSFLVDIFDEKWFSTGFKNSESQTFSNPYVSILACGVSDWLMTELKMNLFKGGLGRRLILVCDEAGTPVPDPFQPCDHAAVKKRVVDHLKKVHHEDFQGEFVRTEAAKQWWYDWYVKHKSSKSQDPILQQFDSTKHVMVVKLAMLLACTEYEPKLVLTEQHYEMAVLMLDDLMPKIKHLTSGIGRNELAGVGNQIIDFLQRTGGVASEVSIKKYFNRYMRTPEFAEQINHYIAIKELYALRAIHEGIERDVYMLPDAYALYQKKLIDQKTQT